MYKGKKPISSSTGRRLQRLQSLSRLLDSIIPLPGGYRIGIDGLLGLIPGIGDIAGGVASSYIIIESARLGASTATLLRMVFNVLVESIIGLIPFLGDLFDFVWKANEKNTALMEKQLQAPQPPDSPEHRLKVTVVIIVLVLFLFIVALAYLGFMILIRLIEALRGTGAS
jgi:hypothetical protein